MFEEGTVFVSTMGEKLMKRNCKFCGVQLTVHEGLGDGVCARPDCRQQMIAEVGADKQARDRKAAIDRANALFEDHAGAVRDLERTLGAAEGEAVIHAGIPFQNKPLVPVPEERRAAFEAHLREIVRKSFAAMPMDGENTAVQLRMRDLSVREAAEAEMHPVLGTACAACRGHCCLSGGTRAHLTPDDIAAQRAREPDLTEEALVALYLGQVPENAAEGRCIMQTADGCAMDRRLRSQTCNTTKCESLTRAEAALHESETGRIVYMAIEGAAAGALAGWSPTAGTQIGTLPEREPESAQESDDTAAPDKA